MKRIVFVVAIAGFTAFLAWAHWPEMGLPTNAKATLIIVKKSERKLYLYAGDSLLKVYPISLGRNPLGPKNFEGDRKTPEGTYSIVGHNPHSSCYLALKISYPLPSQIEAARLQGLKPGGDILIHGIHMGLGWLGRAHRFVDWTLGCIGVTDSEIREIYYAVPDGTPIQIQG
jgi:murein L,D-transpeptidase YafK